MKNLIAYMDVLSESINLLQLPFKGYSSHILFGDFFLKGKNDISKNISAKHKALQILTFYNQKYKVLIKKCRDLRSYSVLEESKNPSFFKTLSSPGIALQQKR